MIDKCVHNYGVKMVGHDGDESSILVVYVVMKNIERGKTMYGYA